MSNIFWDNASTQPMSAKVKQAMVDAPWGNSNSLHSLGLQSKRLIKETEEKIMKLINAPNGKIIWTSGGAAANQLIQGYRQFIITSGIEHKSNLNYSERWGVSQDGYLDEYAWNLFSSIIFSLQLVNNELGTYQPIEKLNQKFDNQIIHSDCVQALGKYSIDVQKLSVQSISFSAHKIGGPKGIGCLWVSNRLSDRFPDDHFTLNIPGIIGFGAALDEIDIDDYQAKMEALNETLFSILVESDLYSDRLFFNNLLSISRGSSIFSIQTPGIDGADLMMALDNQGVYVSTGSACSAGDTKPSHVLKAIGLTDIQALQTIRISLSKHNTVKEVIEGCKILINTIKELK